MSPAGTPRVQLNRRYRFSASHRLHVQHLSADRNQQMFGCCNNPHGHGHNYTLQVTFGGPVDPATGMLVSLEALDAFVHSEVLERFDVANLNHDAAFAACVPSTENLAMVLWQVLLPFVAAQPGLRLLRVRLEETRNNAFDYYGGEPSAFTEARDGQPGKDLQATP